MLPQIPDGGRPDGGLRSVVFGLRPAVCTQIIDASPTPDRFPQVAAEPRSCSVIRAMVGPQTSDMHRMRLIFARKGSSAYSPRASRCIGGGWRLHRGAASSRLHRDCRIQKLHAAHHTELLMRGVRSCASLVLDDGDQDGYVDGWPTSIWRQRSAKATVHDT